MANSILGGNAPINPQMLQQFRQFRNSFTGDPKQAVMAMLQSGQINNAQLQQAMQAAQRLQSFLK